MQNKEKEYVAAYMIAPEHENTPQALEYAKDHCFYELGKIFFEKNATLETQYQYSLNGVMLANVLPAKSNNPNLKLEHVVKRYSIRGL